MPELKNIRHEKFCLLYVICGNATRSYREAGYPSKNPDVNASRLLGNAGVQARINELKPKIELISDSKPRNRESLIEWLEDLMGRPSDEPVKWSDKLRAGEIIARICGYNAPDQLELSAGSPLTKYLSDLRSEREVKAIEIDNERRLDEPPSP